MTRRTSSIKKAAQIKRITVLMLMLCFSLEGCGSTNTVTISGNNTGNTDASEISTSQYPNDEQKTAVSGSASDDFIAIENGMTEAEEIGSIDGQIDPVDLEMVFNEVYSKRKELEESPSSFADIEKYAIDDPGTADLLTGEECQALLNMGAQAHSVTADLAKSDVDLLFRTLHSAYGAYYYFGESTFNQAEDEILAWIDLNSQEAISTKDLNLELMQALSFIQDCHFGLGRPKAGEELMRFEYYYAEGFHFQKDDDGFFLLVDGEKWYLDEMVNGNVSLEYSLLEDGRVVYSPVLFCPAVDIQDTIITLTNALGSTRTGILHWTESQAYGDYYREPDYHLLRDNGIAYISERCFDASYDPTLRQFVSDAATLTDASVIILDIRSNGGGSDHYCKQWIEHFTGLNASYKQVFTNRWSKFREQIRGETGEAGTFTISEFNGQMISNKIPVIVLVDDHCGSSGESMLKYIRTLENVLVVGSNSAGAQLCGNQISCCLPNTKIRINFGVSMSFYETIENVDYRGYLPDVWCDPQIALDSVLQMLEYYHYVDDITALAEDLKSITTESSVGSQNGPELEVASEDVVLIFEGSQVPVNSGFGSNMGTHTVYLQIDGETVTDYTLTLENNSIICEEQDDGTIEVTPTTDAQNCWITFLVNGIEYSFHWINNPFITDPSGTSQSETEMEVSSVGAVLIFDGSPVPVGGGFGSNAGTHIFYLQINGKTVTDYTLALENNSIICERQDDGTIEVTSTTDTQNCWITFSVNGVEYSFRWINNPFL